MNELDLLSIEQSLGYSLPFAYRQLMQSNMSGRDVLTRSMQLYDDANSIMAFNLELRTAEYAPNWNPSDFAFAASGFGDTYLLDLRESPPTVFLRDHETGECSQEAATLSEFIEITRAENTKSNEPLAPLARQPWWKFW